MLGKIALPSIYNGLSIDKVVDYLGLQIQQHHRWIFN